MPRNICTGVVSFRDLLVAPGDKLVSDVMRTEVISAPEDLDQEALSKLFMRHHLLMMPIVDAEGRIKGVVNVNDIVDVVQEEATEDIQKLGARRNARRALPADSAAAHDPQARRLVGRALSRRNADRDRDGTI